MYVRGIDVAIVFSGGGAVMYMYVRGIDVAFVFSGGVHVYVC
jgi:hypothetical protein